MSKLHVLMVCNCSDDKNCLDKELQCYPEFEFTRFSMDYNQHFETTCDIEPSIVIMQFDYFDKRCLRIVKEMNACFQETKYIFMGKTKVLEHINEGIRNKVFGWIMEDITINELIVIINIVQNGAILLYSKGIKNVSMDDENVKLGQGAEESERVKLRKTTDNDKDLISTVLTPREIEVLTLVAEGATNNEISKILYISENTVKTHVQRILGKLQFNSRTRAARYAIELGLKKENAQAE